MAALDYLAFDCDNHYYEAHDAFTRHVPRAMQPRCVTVAEIDGRKYRVGRELSRGSEPTGPDREAGRLRVFSRQSPHGRTPRECCRQRAAAAHYLDAERSVAVTSARAGGWLFPTLASCRGALKHDPGGGTLVQALKPLAERTGAETTGKDLRGAYLRSRFDCAIPSSPGTRQGARVVVGGPHRSIRAGPAGRPQTDLRPVRARAAEAGIRRRHAGDPGYTTHGYKAMAASARRSE